MSLIANGNLGSVYQPDYFEARQVLSADSALTTTATAASDFSFNVAKNERVVFRFTLFYDQDNAGDDLQFTIKSTDANGDAVVPAFYSEHVNAIVPGGVDTKIGDERMARLDPESRETLQQKLVAMQPVGRFAQPEEIAPIVLFLASDESAMATGGVYPIDGGWTAQ